MNNLHTIIYKGRDNAAYHPCTAQCTYYQQDKIAVATPDILFVIASS